MSETPPPPKPSATSASKKESIDPDADGIESDVDKCPNDAEDKDGFEDDDGCPDPDNDLDHIPDVSDKCPNEPETYNGFEDEDGCPDMGKVIVPPMHTERWRVLPSHDVDDGDVRSTIAQVASLLRAHPGLGVLHVRGDADRVAKIVASFVEHGVLHHRVHASIDEDAAMVKLALVEG
jgi:hypothetical protein